MGVKQALNFGAIKQLLLLGGLVFGTAFKWALVAVIANFFGALAILVALDSDGRGVFDQIDHATDYFFVSGAAGMLAIGLLTTSVAELAVRTKCGQVAFITGLVAFTSVVLLAAVYGDFLTGAPGVTRNEAQAPSLAMIASAAAIGAWSHLVQEKTVHNVLGQRAKQESLSEPKASFGIGPASPGNRQQVAGEGAAQ